MRKFTLFLIKVLLIASLFFFFFTPYVISGSSMEETLSDGDIVLTWNLYFNIERGDIVSMSGDNYGNEGLIYCKRVIAIPEDTLTYDGVNLYINGELAEEDFSVIYWYNITGITLYGTFIIPQGKYLVLGDNREVSYDSRKFGLVDRSDILGKVVFRIYSKNISNIGLI